MVRVLPLSFSRYDTRKVGRISDVVTLPYDALTPMAIEDHYSRHPLNFVRIEAGRELPSDGGKDNRHTRAVETWNEWREKEIIVQDETPSFFIYEIRYHHEGLSRKVRGVVGMVEFPRRRGRVIPLQTGIEESIEERLDLIRRLGAFTSPVITAYRDEEGTIREILDRLTEDEPEILLGEEDGPEHRIWRISSEEEMRALHRGLSRRDLIILDGFNRYMAAMRYGEEKNRTDPTASPLKAYNFFFSFMLDICHEAVTVLPYHRVVKKTGLTTPDLVGKLASFFEVESYPFNGFEEKEKELANLMEEISTIGLLNHAFGLYGGGGEFHLLYLKDADAYERMVKIRKSRRWKRLDVTVLHSLIFGEILGLSDDRAGGISYHKSANLAVSAVDSGASAAFLLNQAPIEHVLDLAESGETLPAKSAYFYPKPLVGIFPVPVGDFSYVEEPLP